MIELTPKNLRRYKIHLVCVHNKIKKIKNKKKFSLAFLTFILLFTSG